MIDHVRNADETKLYPLEARCYDCDAVDEFSHNSNNLGNEIQFVRRLLNGTTRRVTPD
jgi:hypothetical protein